jgi:hypothetical protein
MHHALLTRIDGDYKTEGDLIQRHGQGEYHCSTTQNSYIGTWDSDKMNGKGTLLQRFSGWTKHERAI